MNTTPALAPPKRDFAADFHALTQWGQNLNSIFDDPEIQVTYSHRWRHTTSTESTSNYWKRFALLGVLIIAFIAVWKSDALPRAASGICLVLLAGAMIFVVFWYSNWGDTAKVAWIRKHMADIDRAHFDQLIHELAGHANLEFTAFVCHMLGYFCFVPRELLNDRADNSPLPVDAHWWRPLDADVEQTLAVILQTPVMQAVPADQYWGVLAHVRRTAQVTLKRWREGALAAQPSREELRRISALIEAAAQHNEGPRLEIGIMLRKYVSTRD